MSAVTLELDDDLKGRLEALAEASGQDLSAFVSNALRMLLDDNDQAVAAIEAGVREADQGDILEFDDVKAELATKMAKLQAG
jgi:RHH-type rel operon transcriptional repressor/antitoxin RelB